MLLGSNNTFLSISTQCKTANKPSNDAHLSLLRWDGSGRNLDGSTAFGMTCTFAGSTRARRIRLSRQVCETQMAAPTVDKVV